MNDMAKKENEELFANAGNSEKLKALQAAMDKICRYLSGRLRFFPYYEMFSLSSSLVDDMSEQS